MSELAGLVAISAAVAVALFLVAVAVLRWVFLAPLVKELRALRAALAELHQTDEYASRQLTSIWHSVNMIRDGERPGQSSSSNPN